MRDQRSGRRSSQVTSETMKGLPSTWLGGNEGSIHKDQMDFSASSSVEACDSPANDVRIDCKAAKHSDGDRGAVLAHLEADLREPRRRSSADCSSAATAARANKRRFVNLLQRLGGVSKRLRYEVRSKSRTADRCERNSTISRRGGFLLRLSRRHPVTRKSYS